ncbi:hypothetical protein THAOC_03047 [Thalassiosira oceanica]|uniref:Uncharacterized protein n=1 Tax=Thalassiosira oceanica TaxID=159749 RepID=K0TQ11_THAOC|nr:hypothetical protein THAOC_03047 [Thalassiosira oceanica]|mmetsp:Transcript_38697/g.92592  ORF Transcript_38697/g.92592 Transcript_38697/m.92592 type:complete len:727 (+) Transcript_38697:185-2365(+)|eukprot:EJK75237.1 hypothetical protein THAOC_03047 [Thalassiosira oceanica]
MFNQNTLSNPLGLFPACNTPAATQAKIQKLLFATAGRAPTEIQRTLALSIFDDSVQYMSTIDMNRAASYTFGHQNSYGSNGTTSNEFGVGTHGESISDQLWELLVDATLCKYISHSPLTLAKTISLIQHVLLFGSEGVTNGEVLCRIEVALGPLKTLNTALVEQQMVERILNDEPQPEIVLDLEVIGQQLSSLGSKATAQMIRLRGGSVDRGHPVRHAAAKLHELVSNAGYLRQLRMQQQPTNTLVPIGSAKQVGYITDEARHQLLQQKIAKEESLQRSKELAERQKLQVTRSNLAGKSKLDSFGGGYTNQSNQKVVGAANSLEDMIKSAKHEIEQHKLKKQTKISTLKGGYTDDPYARERQVAELETQNVDVDFVRKEQALQDALEYLEELQRDQAGEDLLGYGEGASGDLLGTGGNASDASADLLGFGGVQTSAQPQIDVFSMPASTPTISSNASTDLLGFGGPPVQSSAAAFSSPNKTAPSIAVERPKSSTNQLRPSIFSRHQEQPQRESNQIRVTQQPQHLAEEDEAEQSRKMQMADGLFAGVVTSGPSTSSKKTIMSSGSGNSNMSALDDLIPVANATLAAPFSSIGSTNDAFATLSEPTLGKAEPSTTTAPQILDNVFSVNSDQPALDVAMGPMGGSSDSNEMPPLPSCPPPPPPTMPPPPPPISAPPSNQSIGGFQQGDTNQTNNASFEQMQELIRHQQQQMDQMMAMMQQMKSGGHGN